MLEGGAFTRGWLRQGTGRQRNRAAGPSLSCGCGLCWRTATLAHGHVLAHSHLMHNRHWVHCRSRQRQSRIGNLTGRAWEAHSRQRRQFLTSRAPAAQFGLQNRAGQGQHLDGLPMGSWPTSKAPALQAGLCGSVTRRLHQPSPFALLGLRLGKPIWPSYLAARRLPRRSSPERRRAISSRGE